MSPNVTRRVRAWRPRSAASRCGRGWAMQTTRRPPSRHCPHRRRSTAHRCRVADQRQQRCRCAVDPRTSLLDALREQAGLDRHQEGLRPRRLRRLHRAYRRAARAVLPDPRGALPGQGDHHDRGAGRAATICTRCRPRSCTTTDSSAATARPARSCPAAALIKEGHTGSDAEIREWMSGNICRCGAYPNIVAAIRDAAREG